MVERAEMVQVVIEQEIYAHKKVTDEIWESVKQANKVQNYTFFDGKIESLINENINVHNNSKLDLQNSTCTSKLC